MFKKFSDLFSSGIYALCGAKVERNLEDCAIKITSTMDDVTAVAKIHYDGEYSMLLIVPGEMELLSVIKIASAEMENFADKGIAFKDVVVVLEGKDSYKILDVNGDVVLCETSKGEKVLIDLLKGTTSAYNECDDCQDRDASQDDEPCDECDDCQDRDVSQDDEPCDVSDDVNLPYVYPDFDGVEDKDFADTLKNANEIVTLNIDNILDEFRNLLVNKGYLLLENAVVVDLRDLLGDSVSESFKDDICENLCTDTEKYGDFADDLMSFAKERFGFKRSSYDSASYRTTGVNRKTTVFYFYF